MSDLVETLREVVRDLAARERDDAWPTLLELGFAAIGLPEEQGGAGGGFDDLVALVGELARVAVCSPIIEAATAAWILGAAPRLAPAVPVDASGLALTGDRLHGALRGVRWCGPAGSLLLVDAGGTRLVRLDQDGVNVAPAPRIYDPIADVTFDGAMSSTVPDAPGRQPVLNRLAILRAAALAGAARGALDRTVDYVRTREQFGGPLAVLPAVVTAVGRMTAELDLVDAAVAGAVRSFPSPNPGPAAAARLVAAAAATSVARTAHQLHGAMGVSQEYPLHPLTRSLWDWRDADQPQETIAAGLGALARRGGEPQIWEVLSA